MSQEQRDPKHIKRITGEADPYIKSVVIDGQLQIIEITKEEYEELTNRAFQTIDAYKQTKR